ncbi:MAG: histidine kinase, partial [Pirellulales bacterium]|nr:histidine kinase [Pirellulales bacterium]
TTAYSVRAVPIQISGAVVSVVVTLIDTRLAQAAESLQRESQQNLQKLLTLHERERQLISYEIHDGLAQYLAGAAMQLEAFDHACRPHSKSILKDSFHFLEEGLRLVGASVDESRRLVSGMRPLSLDELGIISAVEILVDEARIDIPHVEYSWSEGILRFCPGLETTVFRIVQESLTNIRKHSDAHRASVRLERRGDSDLAIIVTDDGIGFDLTAVAANHFGIEGICQRAKIYGREALITSSIGKGSRVEVVLPFIPDTRNEQQS